MQCVAYAGPWVVVEIATGSAITIVDSGDDGLVVLDAAYAKAYQQQSRLNTLKKQVSAAQASWNIPNQSPESFGALCAIGPLLLNRPNGIAKRSIPPAALKRSLGNFESFLEGQCSTSPGAEGDCDAIAILRKSKSGS